MSVGAPLALGTCLGPPGVKLAVAAAGNSAEQERKNKKKGAADDATTTRLLRLRLRSPFLPSLCAPMASDRKSAPKFPTLVSLPSAFSRALASSRHPIPILSEGRREVHAVVVSDSNTR